MKPVKVKDYRAAAIEMYRREAGVRCTRCSEPVRTPNDGELWKLGTEYLLVHSKPCKPRR